MTDRYHSLTVVLEKDTRTDDAECLLNAIRMMRGVLSVAGNVADLGDIISEERAKHELRMKLYEALK